MKKIIYLYIIICSHTIFSQQEIGLSTGYVTNGYGIMIDYSRPINESAFTNIGFGSFFSVDKTDDFEIAYQTYTASSSYYLKVRKAETNNLSLGLGAIGSYQRVSDSKEILEENSVILAGSKIIYGVAVSGVFDYRIANAFKVFAIAMQNYHVNSDIGEFSFYGGVGLRYLFF